VAGRSWAALAAIAALVLGGAGCASSGGPTTVRKVSIMLPGSLNDPDWTRLSREKFETLVSQLHVRGSIAVVEDAANARAGVEQLANERHKPQLIIADDSHYAAAAVQVAKKTKVPVLVWGDPGALKRGLVGDVEVEGRAAAYVAGYLGVRSAISREVGIVVADDGTPSDLRLWNEMAGAYASGARNAMSGVRVHYTQVGSGGNATTAQVDSATTTLMKHRAQYILVLGGRTTIGAFNSITRANHHGLYFNEQLFGGVISDKERLIEQSNEVFVTIPWNFAMVFQRAIADVRSGNFGKHVYTLSLANGGLKVNGTGRTPNDAYEAALALGPKVDRGTIKVPTTTTASQVEALTTESAERSG
jgi:basic membrane lipoprotein Med (substrate-binding protein (PBP1-ABC) superfamily)